MDSRSGHRLGARPLAGAPGAAQRRPASSRRAPGAAAAALVLTLALLLPAIASALAVPGNSLHPFPGIPQSPPQVQSTTTPPPGNGTVPSSTSGGGGLSGADAVIIALVAVVILGGIALFIWRDARHRAPVPQRTARASPEGRRPGSKQRVKPRKRARKK